MKKKKFIYSEEQDAFIVNTLLEVTRLESGAELKPTDFNFSETARTVLISLESKISKKNIDIQLYIENKNFRKEVF